MLLPSKLGLETALFLDQKKIGFVNAKVQVVGIVGDLRWGWEDRPTDSPLPAFCWGASCFFVCIPAGIQIFRWHFQLSDAYFKDVEFAKFGLVLLSKRPFFVQPCGTGDVWRGATSTKKPAHAQGSSGF